MTGPQMWGAWLAGSLFVGWILLAVGRDGARGLTTFFRGHPPSVTPTELLRVLRTGGIGWLERTGAALIGMWYATILGLIVLAFAYHFGGLGQSN